MYSYVWEAGSPGPLGRASLLLGLKGGPDTWGSQPKKIERKDLLIHRHSGSPRRTNPEGLPESILGTGVKGYRKGDAMRRPGGEGTF